MCIEGFFSCVVEQRKLQRRRERCAALVEERVAFEVRLFESVLVIARYAVVFLRRRRRERELCKLLALRSVEELRVREAAAMIVARWWRIIPERKAYWRRRTREVVEQRRLVELQRQRNDAATRIQSRFRGLLGRREAGEERRRRVEEHRSRQRCLHDSTDLVRLCLQEYTRRCRRLEREAQRAVVQRNEAAAIIQTGWKAALKRQMLHNVLTRCRRIVRAVLAIQRAYRRFCAGREIRYLRKVQLAMNQDRLDNEYREFRATLTLQCFARIVLAKRAARHRRAAIGRGFFFAAVTIQSMCRGATARMQLGYARELQRQAAAQLLQLVQAQKERVVAVTAAFLHARESCYLTECRRCRRLTEKLYMRRYVRRELLRDKSATIIQRAVRRWIARRRQREVEEKACAMRALVLACVVRIQSVMRGFLARQQYRLRRYLSQQQERRRRDMEEVMVQLWIDEWRAAILQCEGDRRRIETLETRKREMLEYCCKMDAKAAAAAVAMVMTDSDDEEALSLSTYRDDL
ncbi:hypothetical protein DQ04_09391000 [Trypanosoma grayi]|uniref:hypothetical protein n=1 Tax=Trypanosoma grayi TaxID=71804 RepID=UPI0004F41245|nr:hypothetical protein DQ04_09391000 [Trypanosoma grayi]KEG07572.1 hypothetical protein DQ04_09391000 [Trypanosoma grayi]